MFKSQSKDLLVGKLPGGFNVITVSRQISLAKQSSPWMKKYFSQQSSAVSNMYSSRIPGHSQLSGYSRLNMKDGKMKIDIESCNLGRIC